MSGNGQQLESENTEELGRWQPSDVSQLWTESPEYQRLFLGGQDGKNWRASAKIKLRVGTGFLGAALLAWVALEIDEIRWSPAIRLFLGLLCAASTLVGVCLFIVVAFQYGAARRAFYERVRHLKAREVDNAVEKVGKSLRLEDLFVLNRRQLDEYHVLSVRQAGVAFRNAQAASIVAFIILVAGASIALQQTDPSGRYVAAGLSGLGAALSAFLSRTFFRSYQETRDQLRQYYSEPFRTSQILSLERLARQGPKEVEGNLPGDIDAQLRREIVNRLLDQFSADAEAQRTPPQRRGSVSRNRGTATSRTSAKTGESKTDSTA